jgi:ankyrin repeat protein
LLEKAGDKCVRGGPEALALAVKKGYVGIVRAHLDAGMDPNWQPGQCVIPRNANLRDFEWEGTPLITAIANNRMEIVEMLLKAEADVRLKANTTGFTVLHAAAYLEEPAAAELTARLIALGADPNALTLPYMMRESASLPSVLSPLQYAVLRANWACAKALIRHGANLKQPGLFDPFLIPEHGAIPDDAERQVPKLEFLLTNGADPNTANDQGMPPLQTIIKQGNAGLLKLFLKHGADANVKLTGWKRNREPGHGDPFAATTGKWEDVPGSLLGCVSSKDPQIALEITRLLLDAGAKADGCLGPVNDWVARLDESGDLIRRLLAQRPDYVNVAETPDMSDWTPASRRAFLDEVLIPALSKEKGVLLLDATSGRWQPLANESGAATWPDLAGLLWQNLEKLVPQRSIYETTADGKRKYKTVSYWPRITVFQTSPDGTTRTGVSLKSAEPFPPLRPDMVIEFANEGGPSFDSRIKSALDWHLRKRVRVPVTIEQGGKSREVTLCGNLLVFDSTSAELPLLNIGALARMFLPRNSVEGDLALKSGTVFTIRHKDGGELRVDAGGENNSSLIPTDAVTRSYLRAGDRLIIPKADWALMRPPAMTAEPLPPIRVAIPEWSFHRSYFMGVKNAPTSPRNPASSRSSRPSERTPTAIQSARPESYPPPTLFEILADVLSPELDRFVEDRKLGDDDLFATLATESDWSLSVILPHPDFSSVLIKRAKDGGGETMLKVDLTPLIARCQDDTDPAEFRKSDVPLLPGDTVEFSLRADKLSQPWTGLSPAEERLFSKALGGTITLREPDGVIHDFDLVYQQPAWRATPAGLLPFAPEKGSPSTRASRVRFPQRSTGRIFRDEATIDSGSFLREGDRMRVDFYDHANARVRPSGQIPTRRVPKVLDIPNERGRPAR